MGRSIAAVIVGYLAMAILIFTGTTVHIVLLFGGMPSESSNLHPGVSYAVINLLYSTVFAAFGGWVCATIASQNRLKHGIILAAVVFVLSLISVYIDRGQQPLWYQACLVLMGAPATVAGAWLKASRQTPATA